MNFKKLFIFTAFIVSSLAMHAQNARVQGRVFDELTNEPIPFVNVIIDGTTIGTPTDLEGNFLITGLEAGFVQLRVSYLGYKPVLTDEIRLTNNSTAYIDIPMRETDTKIEEVVVKASPFKKTEESPISLRNITLTDIEKNPGSNRDISLVVQSFPGVGSTPAYRNDIIVRGGGPGENSFYLDGVEVPNINHFATQGASGGRAGILNADFIRNVDYYSGSFPAARGHALSGIFEFRQKDGNKEDLAFSTTVGASEVALSLDGPIGEKTTFLLSARQSYLQFLFTALELPFLPTFNDFQFKSRTRLDDKNELTLIGLGAIDRFKLNTGIENPDPQQEYILSYVPVNEQWTYTNGAVYKHFSKNSYQTFVISRNMLNNNSYKYTDNDESSPDNLVSDFQSQEIENKVRFESTTRINGYKITAGLGGQYAKYNNDTYRKAFIGNELREINYQTDLKLFEWSVFGQVSKSYFNDKLALSLGLRSDASDYSKSMRNMLDQLSPRFSTTYKALDKLSFTAGVARYYQMPAYTTLGYRDETGSLVNKDNELTYIGVDHLIGGFEFLPKRNIQLSVEGFYKDYFNYPFSVDNQISLANLGADDGIVGDEEVRSISEGRAYGFEVLNRYRLDKQGINAIISYTYVRSEFKDNEGEYIPSSWDSRHLLTITAGKKLPRNWTIGMKFRYAGGLPYTPYDMETSSLQQAWDLRGRPYLDYNRFNSERLSGFQQLDLRIDKSYFFNKWTLTLYVDVQNLYNFKAEQQDYVILAKDANGNPIINQDSDTGLNYYELESIDSFSGTVLPSIGIQIYSKF